MRFLNGEIVVVSGSSQGIGRTTALLAAKEGAGGVVVNGRRKEKTELVAAQIRELGVRAESFQGDLSDSGVPASLIDFAVEKFGRLDILINNIGTSDRYTLEDLSEPAFLRIIQTNLFSTVFATQAAVKVFVEKGIDGSIVCNGSMNGICAQPNLVPYGMTKAAIANFVKTAGHELAMTHARALASGNPRPWIRLNGFYTGWTHSDGETVYKRQENPNTPDDWYKSPPLSGVPSGVMTSEEEVAGQFLFLASKHCRNINAQNWTMEQFALDGPPDRSV